MKNYHLIVLDSDELDVVRSLLRAAGKTALLDRLPTPRPVGQQELELMEAYADKVQAAHSGDPDVSFDERVAVSLSDDGAFVAAWLWVADSQLEDIPLPPEEEDIPDPMNDEYFKQRGL